MNKKAFINKSSSRNVSMRDIKLFSSGLYPALQACGVTRPTGHCARAFTLIELLVVVLIIGILSAIALPQYQKAVEKSRATQALTLAKSVAQAARVYYLENNQPPTKLEDLAVDIPWTGNVKTLGVISDSRSNQDWALELYSNDTNEIYAVRLAGSYKGAGFIIPMNTTANIWNSDNLYCAEWKSGDYAFGKDPGDYCHKLFAGTLIYPAGLVNIYSLP